MIAKQYQNFITSTTDESARATRLDVIILNWNGWQDTIECLESIFNSEFSDFRVILCDNNSSDFSIIYIKSWAEGRLNLWLKPDHKLRYISNPPSLKPINYSIYNSTDIARNCKDGSSTAHLVIIQNDDNLGYAGGVNIGLSYHYMTNPNAYVLIINNDVVIPKEFLSKAIDCFDQASKTDFSVLGFPAMLYNEPESTDCIYLDDDFVKGPIRITNLQRSQFPVKKNVLAQGSAIMLSPSAPIKFLPEEYFLYCEDIAFCRENQKRNATVAVQLNNFLYHKVSNSAKKGSPLQEYYSRRNKLAYCKKYYPIFGYFTILLRMIISATRGILVSYLQKDPQMTRAYWLSLVHHFTNTMGRIW